MKTLPKLPIIVIAVFSFHLQHTMATPGDEKWAEKFYVPGVAQASGSIMYAAQCGNYLYVAGSFSRIGGVPANKIARLNYATGHWEPVGGGVVGSPNSLVSLGSDVYISGITRAYNTIGPIDVGGIARWDGTNFWPVQGTPVASSVSQLVTSGDGLYARGNLPPWTNQSAIAGGIHRMDINGWTRLGPTFQPPGYLYPVNYDGPLAADGPLWCSGLGPDVGNTFTERVRRWDGGSWLPESGVFTSYVSQWEIVGDFEVIANQPYFIGGGGRFTDGVNGSRQMYGVVTWTGTEWANLGGPFSGGYNGNPSYLAKHNGNLIALGAFTTVNNPGGAQTVNNVAMWNGASWNPIGGGTTGPLIGATDDGDNVILHGSPNTWTWGYGGYVAGENNAINPDGTQIYTGGIVRWNGSSWEAVGGGLGADRGVEAMTSLSNELYLAGYGISRVGQTRVPRIAKVNPATGVVTGLGEFRNASYDGSVYDACTYDGQVVMGGSFTTALVGGGSQTVNNIARWNGSAWNPLGSGVNGAVWSMVVKDGALYVAGEFTQATDTQGTKTVNRVARWNGTGWSALGTGISALQVSSLCFVGADLYAGTKGPGAVWRWTGSAWTNIAALNYYDEPTLGSYRGHLVVGGAATITPTGGAAVQVNGLARLQGTSWIPLGDGLGAAQSYPWVESIKEVDGRLYVGGRFGNSTNPNSPPAGFGVWDGTAWSTVGSGIANSSGPSAGVYCLHASGRDMFIGGSFDIAGGKYVGNYSSFSLMPAGAQTFGAWALDEGLSGADAQPGVSPWHDGVANLLKYAFNLDGSSADVHMIEEGTGRGGLPAIRNVGGVLRVEFLRRVGSSLNYRPMKSISLAEGSWSDFTDAPTIQSFGADWERVIYEEPIPPDTARIFGTVQVTLMD